MSLSERRLVMGVVIGVTVSVIGAFLYDMDFCTLYTFISISIYAYKEWRHLHTNDKALK